MGFDWGNAFKSSPVGMLFGDNDDDIDKWVGQIPDEMKQYLAPYINAGTSAFGKSGEQYDKLINDPSAFLNAIGANYKASPGYQWKLNQGENAITNAQAAGGMAGSPQHAQKAGELAENLANQDYYDYLKQVMGAYGTGLAGETALGQQGASSAGDLATSLANYLMGRGELKYKQQANQNQLWGSILAGLAGMAGV